jgi:hypothetical protein
MSVPKTETSEHPRGHTFAGGRSPDLEYVKGSTGVKARLLVDSSQQSRLGTLLRQQSGGEVELEALGNLVLELNLGAKHVRGRPRLGEGETVVLEVVFGLEVAGDSGLGIPDESNLEGHAGRRGGLDVESGAVNGEVLAEEVIGGLSKVLETKKTRQKREDGRPQDRNTFQEGGTG